MEDEKTFENRIKDFRKNHNLSQEQLADALGISRQSVIALEQGRSLPSFSLIVEICQFFDSDFEDIFKIHREIENEINKVLDQKESDNQIINVLPSSQPGHHPTPFGLRTAEKEKTMSNEMEPWRPFREMVSLRDAMDRLFEDSVITPKSISAMPKIDIKDKKDSIEVRAELPGLKEEDIDIEIHDGIMTISGEKKEEKEEKEEGYYYKESHSGAFSRSFTLPADVKAEKAEAEIKNGVLIVAIPKIEAKKATKVKIAPKAKK